MSKRVRKCFICNRVLTDTEFDLCSCSGCRQEFRAWQVANGMVSVDRRYTHHEAGTILIPTIGDGMVKS
ncbi:TPA: hypothetical protein DF272_06485 [Candidatus Falkowbacteria bacterium]|nr:hypothetical protein [Candidatus Falkowbacteria bacterium]